MGELGQHEKDDRAPELQERMIQPPREIGGERAAGQVGVEERDDVGHRPRREELRNRIGPWNHRIAVARISVSQQKNTSAFGSISARKCP